MILEELRKPQQLTEELEAEIVERLAEASEGRVVLTKKLARLADERQTPAGILREQDPDSSS
ncbi:MAG: hypothetical protein L0206_03185 [Actinobacteria bacterium]|nr:hypothetical protein [Actinomycetota bacterium]